MKIFKEEQRFTQTWFIALMAISLIIPLILMINEFLKENSKFTTMGFLTTVSILVVSILPIFFFKLTTRIDEYGIHYKFFPFHLSFKTIEWNSISNAFVRAYDPIGEYGGWGLKGGAFWNSSKGKAINVSGDLGIQLELKDGKKLLIGTHKKFEAENIILQYKTKFLKDD